MEIHLEDEGQRTVGGDGSVWWAKGKNAITGRKGLSRVSEWENSEVVKESTNSADGDAMNRYWKGKGRKKNNRIWNSPMKISQGSLGCGKWRDVEGDKKASCRR